MKNYGTTTLLCPWNSPGKNTGVGCHFLLQCMKVKSESEVAQSCVTPSDPMDCSLPGSSVHGIYQAGVLEWVAIAFSIKDGIHSSIKFLNSRHKGVQGCVCVCVCVCHSVMSDSVTPWNVACQAPLSMEFSRQGYWSGLPLPSPGSLPNPGIEPWSPALQVYALPSELKFLNSRHEDKSYKFPKRKIKLFLK